MKIVIAPNAFKGSLTAAQAAGFIEAGIRDIDQNVECVLVPVADGGDGLVDVFVGALRAQPVMMSVRGPLNARVDAEYCFAREKRMAAVEMARASGLALLTPQQRDPTRTTTYGTGELIADALLKGAEKVVIGIGGSATTDGGIGMAAALGAKFLDKSGHEVLPVGGELINIAKIDLSEMLPQIHSAEFEVACDVDNPLIGENGAAAVYGPQKGATPLQVEQLEKGLAHLAGLIEEACGMDVRQMPGAGAAGGLGAGLKAFLNAKLRKGIDLVFEAVGLEERMEGSDLVYTSEGQIDFQTKFGKAPAGVGIMAQTYGIPCFALAGSIGEGVEQLREIGINAVFSICPGPVKLQDAMERGGEYLRRVAAESFAAFMAGRQN